MFTLWFFVRQMKKLMILISTWKENKREREIRRAAMPEWERQQAEVKKSKILKVCWVIGCISVGFYALISILAPGGDYSKANDLIKEGEYIEAYELLESLDGYRDSEFKAREIYTEYINMQLDEAKAGGIVRFGFYEQDNDLDDGKEPIEWLVLKKHGNKVLVISEYGLDYQAYNNEQEDVTWENCTLRKWLNNEFLEDAFEENLQKQIAKTNINNKFEYSRGMLQYTENGKNTKDKIFLLSHDEFEKDFVTVEFDDSYYGKYNKLDCETTEYVDKKSEYSASSWWLRTSSHGFAKYVRDVVTDTKVSEYKVVRPALWIKLES